MLLQIIHSRQQAGKGLAHSRGETRAFRRQFQRPGAPQEQGAAELRLQGLDLLADGSRGHEQLSGRELETHVACRRFKAAQTIQG